MISRRATNRIVGAIFIFAAAMGLLHVTLGRLTGDEGWYLHSGRLVTEGKLPYRDFFFTQPPLLPYFYGSVLRCIGEGYYGGRMLSFFLLMASMGILWKISRDLSGPVGGAVATALVGLNLFAIMQGCSVMTPSLAMFFILASVYFLVSPCSPHARAALSVLCLSLAASARLSVLPGVLLLVVYLYFSEGRRLSVLATGLATAAVVLGLVFMPFLLADGRAFFFGTFGFHSSHRALPLGLALTRKLDFVLACISDFLPAVFAGAVMLAGIAIRFRGRGRGEFRAYLRRNHLWAYLGSLALLITLFHFIVTVPYPTYEVMLLPVIAVVIGGWVSGRLRARGAGRSETILTLTALIILACLSMPFQEYVLDTSGGFGPVREISEVAELIRRNAGGDVTILTLDAGIAYQGGFDLLPGLEMSEFSFFPAWSTDRCRARKVVNAEILRDAILQGMPDVIALRNRDIYMIGGSQPSDFIDIIRDGYRWVNTATQYGQFSEPLHIFTRKEGDSSRDEGRMPDLFSYPGRL